jgi:hypothetical protein
LFGNVIVVAFQSVFRAEMHQNDIFFIFKKLFLRSGHQNDPKNTKKLIFSKKKLILEEHIKINIHEIVIPLKRIIS